MEVICFIEIVVGVIIGMYLIKANITPVAWTLEFMGGVYSIAIGVYLAMANDLPKLSKWMSMMSLFGGALVIVLLIIDRFWKKLA